MATEQFYLEEGFPFHSRKLEQMKDFLKRFDLTYGSQIQYSVFLKTCFRKIGRLWFTPRKHIKMYCNKSRFSRRRLFTDYYYTTDQKCF